MSAQRPPPLALQALRAAAAIVILTPLKVDKLCRCGRLLPGVSAAVSRTSAQRQRKAAFLGSSKPSQRPSRASPFFSFTDGEPFMSRCVSVRGFYQCKGGSFMHLEEALLLNDEEARRMLTHNAIRSLRASQRKLDAAGMIKWIDEREVSRIAS
jgi:hypothetical protein